MVNSALLGTHRAQIEKNPLESLEIPPNQLKTPRNAATRPHPFLASPDSLAVFFGIGSCRRVGVAFGTAWSSLALI